MNAFYRFIIGLSTVLLFVAAVVSYLGCAALIVLWEWMARETDRREQMRTYRESVWDRRMR